MTNEITIQATVEIALIIGAILFVLWMHHAGKAHKRESELALLTAIHDVEIAADRKCVVAHAFAIRAARYWESKEFEKAKTLLAVAEAELRERHVFVAIDPAVFA